MGGIGMATAKRLAEDGYQICLLVHKESKEVTKFLSSISGTGHFYHVCNVSNETDVDKTITKIIKKTNSIDVCVHTAVDAIIRKSVL